MILNLTFAGEILSLVVIFYFRQSIVVTVYTENAVFEFTAPDTVNSAEESAFEISLL